MPIKTASSNLESAQAVAELKQRSGAESPLLVIFFASSRAYEIGALGQLINQAFPGAMVIGSSTAGELVDNKMLEGSVVAMFIGSDILEDVACAVVEDISTEMLIDVAFKKLEQQLKTPIQSLDIHKNVGLVIADGMSGAEERLMEKLGDRTDLFFVGGSAGDDLQFNKAYVFAEGKASSNSALLVILRLKNKFDIVKTQSFKPLGITMIATKVDELHRQVIEFDNKPALSAYCEALSIDPKQAQTLFYKHPLGLMVGDEPYVRSPRRAEGSAMDFYCQIKEGMELELLEGTDIISDTRAALESKKKTIGKIDGLLHFHCILRTLQLRDENLCEQYGELFAGIPTAGFSTYGEEYLGHVNQTSTMLVFHG